MLSRAPKDAADALHKSIDTNVIGNIYLNNVFLPLILKGKAKKIIAISSGMADLGLINKFDVQIASLYSASKAALNVILAKYSAQYKKQGVLFLSISPGVVDTGNFNPASRMYYRFFLVRFYSSGLWCLKDKEVPSLTIMFQQCLRSRSRDCKACLQLFRHTPRTSRAQYPDSKPYKMSSRFGRMPVSRRGMAAHSCLTWATNNGSDRHCKLASAMGFCQV